MVFFIFSGSLADPAVRIVREPPDTMVDLKCSGWGLGRYLAGARGLVTPELLQNSLTAANPRPGRLFRLRELTQESRVDRIKSMCDGGG
jgi:hypothetical protein